MTPTGGDSDKPAVEIKEPKDHNVGPSPSALPITSHWKTIADLLPVIGFFGVFFLFGRDIIWATAALVVGLLAQLAIYKLNRFEIPKWMLILTGVALAFATLTLLFQDPHFIKVRSSITGFLVGCFFLGSVLIKKNILKMIAGKVLIFPNRTWDHITILWSIPIFLNAAANLVMANLMPGVNFQFSDDVWMTYRALGAFVVVGCSFALVIGYCLLTKQRPRFGDSVDAS